MNKISFIKYLKIFFTEDMELKQESPYFPGLPKVEFPIRTKTGRFNLIFERQLDNTFQLFDIKKVEG